MSHVVAIAAPPGGGKTSLVNALTQRLGSAVSLYFDHYQTLTEQPIEDIAQWMRDGADFNAFVIPRLVEDLAALKRAEDIIDPGTGQRLAPQRFVVFEMPLGRGHDASAPYIDYLVWIDVPADLALARTLRECVRNAVREDDAAEQAVFLRWCDGYLENYLDVVADTLALQREQIRADADLVLDGRASPDVMAQTVVDALAKSGLNLDG